MGLAPKMLKQRHKTHPQKMRENSTRKYRTGLSATLCAGRRGAFSGHSPNPGGLPRRVGSMALQPIALSLSQGPRDGYKENTAKMKL